MRRGVIHQNRFKMSRVVCEWHVSVCKNQPSVKRHHQKIEQINQIEIKFRKCLLLKSSCWEGKMSRWLRTRQPWPFNCFSWDKPWGGCCLSSKLRMLYARRWSGCGEWMSGSTPECEGRSSAHEYEAGLSVCVHQAGISSFHYWWLMGWLFGCRLGSQ